jgi:Serpin (serine protease inhibitor)
MAAFGLALYSRLCAPQPTANLLLSPASAAQTLGMLYAGSAGPTADSVGQLLRLPAWTPALVAELHNQTAALARCPSSRSATTSSSRPDWLPPRVLDDLRTAFDTDLRQVDFAAPFHSAAGGTVSATQMDSPDPVAGYHSVAGWQSAILPYTGGRHRGSRRQAGAETGAVARLTVGRRSPRCNYYCKVAHK